MVDKTETKDIKETKVDEKKSIKNKLELLIGGLGGDSLRLASKIPYIKRIPTGVFQFDFATGGGLPVGFGALLWGPQGSCKSTLAWKSIGAFHKRCSNCHQLKENCKCKQFKETAACIVAFENTIDKSWLAKLGVDNDRCLLATPVTAEEVLDLSAKLIESQQIDILVIDSIASLAPLDEVEASAEDKFQGLQARLVGGGMRRFQSALNKCQNEGFYPTIVLINQLRLKIGTPMFMNPETTPGGKSPGFFCALEARIHECGNAKHYFNKEFNMPVFKRFAFEIKKNNLGSSGQTGEFNLLESDTDMETKKKGDTFDEIEIIKLAIKYDVIADSGNEYTWKGHKFAGTKEQKGVEVLKFFLTDRKAYEELYNQTLNKMFELSSHMSLMDFNQDDKKGKR